MRTLIDTEQAELDRTAVACTDGALDRTAARAVTVLTSVRVRQEETVWRSCCSGASR